MSIDSKFSSHAEAVKAGWFSRRHQTRNAHDQARWDWQQRQITKQTMVDEQRARTKAGKAA